MGRIPPIQAGADSNEVVGLEMEARYTQYTSKGSCPSWKKIVKSLDDGKVLIVVVVLVVLIILVVSVVSVVSVVTPKLKCQSAKVQK